MANLVVQWIQINGIRTTPLVQQVKNFNNPDLSDINITFNGVMSEVYRWEQKVRSVIQLHEMPLGNQGALHDSFNGTLANINWGGNPQWPALQYNVILPLVVPNNTTRLPNAAEIATFTEQRPPLPNQS